MKKSAFSLILGGFFLFLLLTSFVSEPLGSSTVLLDYTNPLTIADRAHSGACYMENKTFQQGERITYKLFYKLKILWLPAGEVVFSVSDNLDGTLHLTAKGRTYKSYEWFFKVRNSYECDIDGESLLPQTSLRQIKEGKHRRLYEKVIFDQQQKTAISDLGRSLESCQKDSIQVEDCMHDLLSVLYYTRNIELEDQAPGSKFPIKVFMDQEVKSLDIIYKGKENRKRIKGRGRFDTIRFSPEAAEGTVLKKGTKMDVWVSDDQNRLPLMIKTPLAGGQIKAILKKYEGLRHPLSSKVK